jgi:PIN domain nuclease of toxin-antitoxin system
MAAVIYLDTNVVLWLAGAPAELSAEAIARIDAAELLLLSPMVELEVEYLYEIGRLQRGAAEVIQHLEQYLPVRLCDRPFAAVVARARTMKWTRDPFDRLIAAQAALGGDPLVTRDKIIRANYPHAVW